MKAFVGLLLSIALLIDCAATVHAEELKIGPTEVEIDVPVTGEASTQFIVSGFTGNLHISMEDIPLLVEPNLVHVDSMSNSSVIELTLYGNESIGNRIFNGKILFLFESDGNIAYGVKIKVIVHHSDGGLAYQEKEVDNTTLSAIWIWTIIGVLTAGGIGIVYMRQRYNGRT